MTPEEFRRCLRILGWKQARAMNELNIAERTLYAYKSGERPVHPGVAQVLNTRMRDRFPSLEPLPRRRTLERDKER